ncbi:MAG: phosphotransferase [Chloroflexi bacterium]|nr:phosphotransferase [Chloroflexota bacterium]MCY3583329.1 phosphotransferase [Chloroflexota bacterium]MCY3716330.1 phosphotransferase [Chloroflexota bacterium]MDE2651343.1 phosphotransferase [Chloroflexota bacterium]MXX82111.1 phosphotransferase [Chloroflexota bacterium]
MLTATSDPATERRLAELTAAQITELARLAADDASLAAAAWRYAAVQGGFGGAIGGTALYRFWIDCEAKPPVSLILKILYLRRGETATSPYYWKREYELYRARLLEDLPARTFIAPKIVQLRDFGDSCWIWMADYADHKTSWTFDDYRAVARRLGRMNGSMVDRDLPASDWLAQSWHSAIVPGLADAFAALPNSLEQPLARITLPLDARDEIMATWRDRELFRAALRQLPQTLCHNDAFRRNILHSDAGVVLLDWALAGRGGLGEELVSLVALALYYSGFTQEYAARLDQAVFHAYIEGLREAGWQGDARLARIGYTCGMTLRGLAGVKQDINLLIDPSQHQELRNVHERDSVEDIAAFFAEVRRFRLVRIAREARRLLAS